MKCPKCGSDVKPNYKFCTKCGQPMSSTPEITHQTKGADLPPIVTEHSDSEKFLGFGRNRQTSSSESQPEVRTQRIQRNAVDEIDVVRGKAVWSIGPGQLARRVSEIEFAQLDDLKGVVIQQGVTAVVTIDGQFMGMLNGGYYEFASKTVKETAQQQADQQAAAEKEDEGILVKAGKVARRVWRFFTGSSKTEKSEERKRRRERIKKNIQKITSKSVVNVTLINTRVFELLFGSSLDEKGFAIFEPMTIRTRVVDLNMGVSLQMQVTDVNAFLENYLSDRDSISVLDIQRILQPSIDNLLNRILRNLDYEAEGLPVELVEVIKKQITATIQQRVFGMEVIMILDVTDQSTDFDRFRAVEHELFASERELGFLQRTGEFRNRLAIETNAQELQDARNEEDLRYALANINRDQLLHDDEMDAFVELLNSQRRLREAKTDEQVYEALQDLRKCRLVKDEDVAILEQMILHKEIERGEATELLRLRVFQNTEEARMRAENALSDLALGHQIVQDNQVQLHQRETEIAGARHNVEMTDLGLQARRQTDTYQREQTSLDYDFFHRRRLDDISLAQRQAEFEREQRRADKFDDMDVLERKAAIARQNMQQMQIHELSLEEMRRKNEALRMQLESTMTQEQIAASHMGDIAKLDAAAQSEMARMMSSENKTRAEEIQKQQERERELYSQMLEMQHQNMITQVQQGNMSQQQMMQMMQSMMGAMTQMGQNATANQQAQFAQQQSFQQQRYQDMESLKNEYREDAIRQQNRLDHTQDSALNYTTRPASLPTTIFCGACGARVASDLRICPHCNEPLDA